MTMRKPAGEVTRITTVSIPRDLLTAARVHAKEERRSVSNVVALALSAYLQGALSDAQRA